ncbi:MAG: hypothetical protein YK1309IOTA_1090004 [Marine Group I thaumarchaeote]|nr:MAG: hypothetical protein YK1309IOTA_1090004 [Marine Group I thaumarchaeote]
MLVRDKIYVFVGTHLFSFLSIFYLLDLKGSTPKGKFSGILGMFLDIQINFIMNIPMFGKRFTPGFWAYQTTNPERSFN